MCSTISGLPGGVLGPFVGPCGTPTYCTGTSPDCPPTTRRAVAAGTLCRPATGVCTVPGYCDGRTFDCEGSTDYPQTAVHFLASGNICRQRVDECDKAATCTGNSPDCPPNGFEVAGSSCGPPRKPGFNSTQVCTGNSLNCSIGASVPCGGAGQPCCLWDDISCRAGTSGSTDTSPYVHGNNCTGGTSGCATPCGADGQPPCNADPACEPTLSWVPSCNGSTKPICIACGAPLQQPCPSNSSHFTAPLGCCNGKLPFASGPFGGRCAP